MKILLVGDTCEDVWVEGDVKRLSPEKPVPVFVPTGRHSNPGMAGNVLANLLSLRFPGLTVTHLMPEGFSVKTRYVDRKTGHHFLRVDEDRSTEAMEFSAFLAALVGVSAVVVSDYAKGFLDDQMMRDISDACHDQHIPLFIDTKRPLGRWVREAFVKINEDEYAANAGNTYIHECPNLIVTRGGDGMDLYRYTAGVVWHLPAEPIEVKDGAGCGDSVLAALVVRWLENGSDIRDAMVWAGKVGALAVSKRGVVAVKREEVS